MEAHGRIYGDDELRLRAYRATGTLQGVATAVTLTVGLLVSMTGPATLAAPRASTSYRVVTDAIDGGGRYTTAGACVINGSLGGFGGIAGTVSPSEVLKQGYVGQLTDATGLSLTAAPFSVDERSTSQLRGVASLDDATVLSLAGSEIQWRSPVFPVADIAGSGVATADTVYTDISGTVTGSYRGVAGACFVQVLDTDPDDFGSYAGDGLDDGWQVGYFGLDNPEAAPGQDPDKDGGDNEYEWITNTHPSNSASLFQIVKIEPVGGVSTQTDVSFDPTFTSRTYQVFLCQALTSGVWNVLDSYQETTNGTERTVRDLNATNTPAFYRVRVTYDP